MKRKTLRTFAVCLIIGVIVVGGGVLAAHLLSPVLVRLSVLPNNKVVDFHIYFTLDPEITSLILEDTRVTDGESPVYDSGEVYLPVSQVKKLFDPFVFWDGYAKKLFITTRTEMLSFTEEDILLRDETVYLPSSLLGQLYPYRFSYREEFNIVTVDHMSASPGMGRLLKDSYVRYRPDKSSDVEAKAAKETIVTVYEPENGFTRIRMENGLLGYVLTEDIGLLTLAEAGEVPKTEMQEPLLSDYIVNTEHIPPRWQGDEPVKLVWESVDNQDGNAFRMETPLPTGANVVSPTWFKFDMESMMFESIASQAYMDWAHEQGAQVWPRVFAVNGEMTHALLTDAGVRARTVEQLCGFIAEFGFDGLNVDLEYVSEADGDYFIQFLRELSVGMGDSLLSVDVLVPQEWSRYYRRADIALTADFVCVMAFDEHYQGSPTSGPVASLGFVEEGIKNTLLEVPKEKILLGLPFYNRVWRELLNNDSPETRQTAHYGMERTKQELIDNGITPEWDAVTGYFYGEFAAVEEDETVLYRIWLEDENSINEKLKIFTEYDLAGIAGWHKGLENAAVWQLINGLE